MSKYLSLEDKMPIEADLKRCSQCVKRGLDPWKPLSKFGKNSRKKDGLQTHCKECRRRYYLGNKEKYRAQSRAQYARNSYYKRNRSKVLKQQVSYQVRRYGADPDYRLRKILRIRVCQSLPKGKQKAGSAIKDLGCSTEALISYLEAKFEPGMTWDNHGTLWQVDHICRLASFDLTDRKQFLAACHFTNLQPLWMEEHLKKTRQEQEQGSRDEEVQLGDHSRAANF